MKKAFTLVELLVVISIMAILTIVTVSQFRTARKRANDVARKGDLNAVAKALQLFFADYGKFPKEWPGGKMGTYLSAIEWGGEFKDSTGYIYMIKLPKENTNGWPQYCYQTDSTQKKYALFAKLEVTSDSECEGHTTYSCGTRNDYCYANVSPNTSIGNCGNFPDEACIVESNDVLPTLTRTPYVTPTRTGIPLDPIDPPAEVI